MKNLELKELKDIVKSCKSMLESYIAYDWVEGQDAETSLKASGTRYLNDYIDKLGYNFVVYLYQELIDKVDHIDRCVYTDSEGLTYNNVIYKD